MLRNHTRVVLYDARSDEQQAACADDETLWD
jgi:hypothetical protein